jgi:UPF0755 protein
MDFYHSKYGKSKRKNVKTKRWIYRLVLIFLLIIAGLGYLINQVAFSPNVWIANGKQEFIIYIKPSDRISNLKKQLYSNGLIIHRKNFEWWAKLKKFDQTLKAGKYKLSFGMSNNDLINKIRNGDQEPVRLIFNNIRLKTDLAGRISQQLNCDSIVLLNLLNDSTLPQKYGFTTQTIACMFIPNTYYLNWTTSEEKFLDRMHYEYQQFWNKTRLEKAFAQKLSPVEVSILASIIDKETQKNDEKARIAGVYLNRLKLNWRLQADPTLIFALGDFTIKRVLNEYMQLDSPYNTYKYEGLPPGPICIPSISSIDAVLNAEQHKFLYFCAKPDYSGYHNFATNYTQHTTNAYLYRNFLNSERIFK